MGKVQTFEKSAERRSGGERPRTPLVDRLLSDNAPTSRVLRPAGDDDSRDLGVAIVAVATGKDGREFPLLRLLTVRSLDM